MGFQIRISTGFILLAALLFFFDDCGLIAACVPAIAVHELGHVLVMLFFGVKPLRLSADTSGLSLDYAGSLDSTAEFFTALSGPALGLMFALTCSKLGRAYGSEYLLLCAGLGTVINLFNLLPCLPLDGGRALRAIFSQFRLGETVVTVLGYITAAVLISSGLWFIYHGQGFAPFIAGIWLLVLQRKSTCKQAEGSVK